VLSQSIHDPAFGYATEFIPVKPWHRSWHNGHISRQH
jgi:hypothetical protein